VYVEFGVVMLEEMFSELYFFVDWYVNIEALYVKCY